MKKSLSSGWLALIVVFLVLVFDQGLKIWVKTNLEIGEEFPVLGNWFHIHFTENNGMAFGLEIPWEYGKLALSLFRIVAVALIGWYLFSLPKKGASKGLMVCGALVFAGAIGNILDSAFYGMLFSDSYYRIAEFLPPEGGYSPFLFGRVVDMLYFPLWEGYLPEWLGGNYFIFFRPVFNIADSAITIGVGSILLFHRGFFKELD